MLSFLFLNPLIVAIILMIGPSITKFSPFKNGSKSESALIHNCHIQKDAKNLTDSKVTKHLIMPINNPSEINNTFISSEFNSKLLYKKIAFISSLINLIVALIIWIKFDGNYYGYQFVEEWIFIKDNYLHVGIDGISLFFIILTTFIVPIVIFSSFTSIKNNSIYFMISFLILESILIAVFIVLDLIFFYITFESCLIPMFLIIGIWGSRQRKILASSYFFLYTLFGSLFMFLCIIWIYSIIGTFDFQILSSIDFSFQTQQWIWLGFLLALAIKTPMIPFHLWLPEAHTEAPLGGSVILAGILLKLASYGFLRVSLEFLPDASNYFTPWILNLAIFSIILSSFTTFRQIDLKRMIAYSSIGHMGIINMGIFSNTIQGIEGAIILSIMHGIVSPALFICVGVLYDRYHIRLIKFYKGLTSKMPIFSFFFFIFILGNMAVPLTGNFIGEFLSFMGIFKKNPLMTIFGCSSMILVAGYSIWLFNRIVFGSESKFLLKAKDVNRREFSILSILSIFTFLFGIYPNIIFDSINFSISFLLLDNLEINSHSGFIY